MTGVDILSSQIMDDLFAIFNGVPLVIAIKYNIHTSASFFPRRDSYLKNCLQLVTLFRAYRLFNLHTNL